MIELFTFCLWFAACGLVGCTWQLVLDAERMA
jgi:hypothetical protein